MPVRATRKRPSAVQARSFSPSSMLSDEIREHMAVAGVEDTGEFRSILSAGAFAARSRAGRLVLLPLRLLLVPRRHQMGEARDRRHELGRLDRLPEMGLISGAHRPRAS